MKPQHRCQDYWPDACPSDAHPQAIVYHYAPIDWRQTICGASGAATNNINFVTCQRCWPAVSDSTTERNQQRA